MTTPALRALHDAVPGRRITLLTSPSAAAVARALPFVADVIVFAAPWMKHPHDDAAPARTAALAERLRERQFDGSVVFTVFTQSALPAALLLLLAGVPLRAAHARENPYALLTDWIAETDLDARAGVRHEVRRQLDLVAALGARATDERLQFPVEPAASARIARLLAAAGVDASRPFIVLHPGATAASRRYPAVAYGAAAAMLSRAGWPVVVTGGVDDAEAVATILAAAPAARALPDGLTVAELAALLAQAAGVVANNSFAAHLAAAVGTPVVDLYALTNPQHTPWAVPHRVLSRDVDCRFCFKSVCPAGHHHCLAGVPPAAIVEAVADLVGTPTRRAPVVDAIGAVA
jgi:lipopolysaccharide heptosyltransferase II